MRLIKKCHPSTRQQAQRPPRRMETPAQARFLVNSEKSLIHCSVLTPEAQNNRAGTTPAQMAGLLTLLPNGQPSRKSQWLSWGRAITELTAAGQLRLLTSFPINRFREPYCDAKVAFFLQCTNPFVIFFGSMSFRVG